MATAETMDQNSSAMQQKENLKKVKGYETIYLEDERSSDQRLLEMLAVGPNTI